MSSIQIINSVRRRIKKYLKIIKVRFLSWIINIVDFIFPFIKVDHEFKHTESIVKTVSKCAYIVNPLETLEEVSSFIFEEKTGVYMRFGDGDVFLALGKDELYQQSRQDIKEEMIEALELKGSSVLKTSMIHSNAYGKTDEMFEGNHLVDDDFAFDILKSTFQYYVGYRIYSHIALHYTATYYPMKANLFLKLLKQKTVLFIGNETTPTNKKDLLFGNVPHIKTPTRNSYDRINEIENEALLELSKLTSFGVVVVAMGCSGRILMKRIYKRNYNVFLFDFGSLLDGICGNDTRLWLKEISSNYEFLDGL